MNLLRNTRIFYPKKFIQYAKRFSTTDKPSDSLVNFKNKNFQIHSIVNNNTNNKYTLTFIDNSTKSMSELSIDSDTDIELLKSINNQFNQINTKINLDHFALLLHKKNISTLNLIKRINDDTNSENIGLTILVLGGLIAGVLYFYLMIKFL